VNQQILVLSPHPDDDAIGCGGTLRKHVLDGDRIKLIVLTSGEGGGHGRQTREETAKVREAEALAACRVVGISDVEFWREPDGGLQWREELVRRLRETIRSWSPQWIYAPHLAELHPDHRAATCLLSHALDAPEHSAMKDRVRLYEVWTPIQNMDEIVDISEVVETKREAIRQHCTQVEVMRLDEAALALNRYRGEMHSWPGGDYAEVFQWLRP
jgi:LmbE family N-acetylglucosaminyl deacetylase